MSYQVLARKWRPKTFREMVGQEHVLRALINALDNNRLHHAYLFTGTRGVGKTTIARILAKCLNCESGVSSTPCGECSACVSIMEGRFVDLIEVDAASRTKVEDTRELLENVQYAPTNGRFKVYLIDEVHMLSTHSFNALLKTLEEPPPHVKFLLATTDPQKLPATILSRCLQFNLKNMSPERIVEHLKHVLGEEQVTYEEPALWLLGRAADGSMRDAMSLADQAISYGSGALSESDVRNMLGTIDQTAVYDIVAALADADGAALLRAVESLSEHAPDFALALEEVTSLLHRIAIAQAVPEAADNSLGDREQVVALAQRLAAEDVQLFYQLGINGCRDMVMAPDPRVGLEMALLRMLAFRPAGVPELPRGSVNNSPAPAESRAGSPPTNDTASASGTAGGVTEAPPQVKKPEPTPVAPPPAVAATSPSPAAPAATDSAPEPPVGDPNAAASKPGVIAPDRPADPPQAVAAEPGQGQPQAPAAGPDEPEVASLSLADLRADTWTALFSRLGFGGVVGNIASHCVLEGVSGAQLNFRLDQSNATLFNETTAERIAEHLSLVLDTAVKVAVSVGPVDVETPAERRQRLLREQRQQALEALQSDPNVQSLISDFGGELDTDSVTPLQPIEESGGR